MGGFKRTVTITYGFIQAMADLTSTKVPDKDGDLVQLCTAGGTHAPTKPTWDPLCGTCNTTVKRDTLVKGHEVAKDIYAVMTTDEIAALKAEDNQFKGVMALTAHDALEVEAKTMPSGTSYYLAPNPKDKFYGLLRQMILDSPDLAFVCRYTVTSRATMYRVRPYGEVLLAEQMMAPEEMLAPPVYEPTPVPEKMLEMARDVARGFVAPFDPAAFADTYKANLLAAIGAREAEPGADLPTVVASAGAVDPMAEMQRQMEAMLSATPASTLAGVTPAEAKAPRKRAPRKKAS